MITKNYEILKLMNNKGMNQAEFSKRSKVISEARLSRILNGYAVPREEEIEIISKLLGVSKKNLESFLNGTSCKSEVGNV